MAKIIAIANLKGGVAKSTTSINLAVACELGGITTSILDLDVEQQACAKWADGRGDRGPIVASPVYTRLQQSIDKMAERVSLILLDCPAYDSRVTDKAISVADLVLVPCTPSVQDVQFLESTIAMSATHNKPTAILFSRVEPNIKETSGAAEFARRAEYPIAPISMSKAVSYHRAITAGMGVGEYEPSGKAASEMRALQEWISVLLGCEKPIVAAKHSGREIAA